LLPSQTADRWESRPDPVPGQEKLYWHILFDDNPQVRALAAVGKERLASFAGLHFTPERWLHITTFVAGLASEVTVAETSDMIEQAEQLLSGVQPIDIALGKVLYHPEAIAIGISPFNALDVVMDAVEKATNSAIRTREPAGRERWIPHVTLAYSTSVQPASPIISALGDELPTCAARVSCIHLIIQEGPERHWKWRSIAKVPFGAPAM
jgi:2'-5' RNA ligase